MNVIKSRVQFYRHNPVLKALNIRLDTDIENFIVFKFVFFFLKLCCLFGQTS